MNGLHLRVLRQESLSSTHDTAACGENAGGAEISEQLNLKDRTEFHGVWGKYQEGYNPENARDRDSFLTASFNQLQASVRAKPLRKENTEPPLSSNSGVQVSLRQCNPPYCPVMWDPYSRPQVLSLSC